MFETAEELSEKLSETGYFIDPTMTKVIFLAARMQKPLLLEARRQWQDATCACSGAGRGHPCGTPPVL